MGSKLQNVQRGRFPKWSVAYARARAALSAHELPPGELVNLNQIEWRDRHYILSQAAQFGHIFKTLAWDDFWICMVGLPHCRRFLDQHSADLTPVTIRIQPMVPHGFLRQMKGTTHQKYRRMLTQAVRPTAVEELRRPLEKTITDGLVLYESKQHDGGSRRDEFVEALNEIASKLLIQLFFGAAYQSDQLTGLLDGFRALGPHGLVWNIKKEQRRAYMNIREQVLSLAANSEAFDGLSRNSVLGQIMESGSTLDDTLVGNLIYMVEMGRFDMYSLFRWITRFAAANQSILPAAQSDTAVAAAFVQEVLRLEQSERLLRTVDRDLIFDNYLIPKFATVRLCLWESHKSEANFHDPFVFNANRFLESRFTANEYAPFGLGEHRCPLAEIALRLCTLFLQTLIGSYHIDAWDDGEPSRGVYHWEPAYQFAPCLKARG